MTVPRETGAIHDIGYRHYTGPRLGVPYIARSLTVHSLRGAFGLGRATRSKVVPFLLLAAMVVPAFVIALVVVIGGADELPLEYTSYAVRLGAVVTIFVAAQSPQAVSRDLRFRLVALYFARPISRATYVRSKLLAMSAALFAFLTAPLVVLYVGALLGELDVWDNTVGFLKGVAGAAMFAVVLASVGLAIAAWTPRRGIGVAAIVTVLTLLGGISAIVSGVAEEQGQDTLAGWAGLISPVAIVDGVQVWLLNVSASVVAGPPGKWGGPVFALAAVALVAACYFLLMRRYRAVTDA
ncbi:MAG TPA: ABC transporter permease [Actinomycetes bacterium]|nr:ABC transporter permease [Actinomycetes bacterium]